MEPPNTESVERKLYEKILYTEDEVTERISELAGKVIRQYQGRNPLFVCLLRGGMPFSARLMSAIAAQDPYFHPELDYMTVRTYGSGQTAKDPEIVMDLGPHTEPTGRPVVLLDDVFDTGATAVFVAEKLRERGVASVDLCVLVRKEKEQPPFNGEILFGFETNDVWLVGMGMDDVRFGKEALRWADYIAKAIQPGPTENLDIVPELTRS